MKRGRNKKSRVLTKINRILFLVIILLLLLTLFRFNNLKNTNPIISLHEEIIPKSDIPTSSFETNNQPKVMIFDNDDTDLDLSVSSMPVLSEKTIIAMQNMQYKKEKEMEKQSIIIPPTIIYQSNSRDLKWNDIKWSSDTITNLHYTIGGGILIIGVTYCMPYSITHSIY